MPKLWSRGLRPDPGPLRLLCRGLVRTGTGAAGRRLRSDLTTAVGLALANQDGVEGGIWQADAGPLAYAFPTYEGTGPKTDLPAAERDQIQAVNQQAARDEQPVDRRMRLAQRRRCCCMPARCPARSAA